MPTAGPLRYIKPDRYQPFILGDVRAHMTPSSYQCDQEAVHLTQPTRGGAVQFYYPAKPRVFTLQGTSGLAGVEGPGGINDLAKYAPLAGRRNYDPIPFRLPSEFRGVVLVWINSFQPSASSDEPLLHMYQMELEEAPLRGPLSPLKSATAGARIAIPAFG